MEQFGDDDPAGQRKAIGDQSALFGCTVDADGLLVEESAVLSSCAWAIGRLCAGAGVPATGCPGSMRTWSTSATGWL